MPLKNVVCNLFASDYRKVFERLPQSLIYCFAGVGTGCSYGPSIIVISTYFEKRRALANGIAFAASSIGAFCFPPLLQYFLDHYGLLGTFIIMAGILFHVSAAGMLFRQPKFFLRRYLLRQSIYRQKQIQSEETSRVDLASAVSDNVARPTDIYNCTPNRSNRTSCVPDIAHTSASCVREVSGDVRVNTSTTSLGSENATTEETDITTS